MSLKMQEKIKPFDELLKKEGISQKKEETSKKLNRKTNNKNSTLKDKENK
jgi:hypothetical protein